MKERESLQKMFEEYQKILVKHFGNSLDKDDKNLFFQFHMNIMLYFMDVVVAGTHMDKLEMIDMFLKDIKDYIGAKSNEK